MKGYNNINNSYLSPLEAFLKPYGFKYNVVTGVIADGEGNVYDGSYKATLIADAKKRLDNKPGLVAHLNTLLCSDFVEEYHPIKAFFESNSAIKPVGVIAQAAACIKPEKSPFCPFKSNDDFIQLFFRKWLIGLVSTIHGTPSQLTLVFSGNPFDVDFFHGLLPLQLSSYYAEANLTSGRKTERLMWENLLVCDPDFNPDSVVKRGRFNSLATRQAFTARVKRCYHDRPRLATLCAVSNNLKTLQQIVKHPSGNWRIIAIDVAEIDYHAFNAIDKTALLMEAFHAWKAGEAFQVNSDNIARMRH